MTKIIFYLITFTLLFISKLHAQDPSHNGEQAKQTFEARTKNIAEKIEKITKEEKEALKIEVEQVNVELENKTITQEEADAKKKKLAQIRALIIESKVDKVYEELKVLVQDKAENKNLAVSVYNDTTKKYTFSIPAFKVKDIHQYQKHGEKRNVSQFVFATGLNNLVTKGSVENSDYRFIGSHFYEWGFTFNNRIFKNDNLLHLKYGFSVMYNNLRPTNNHSFVVAGNQTVLQTNPKQLDDSRFRNVYLVAPVHLEFDFTKKEIKDGKPYFRTHKNVRLGIGGYAGINLKSKQLVKYEVDDHTVTERTKGDFNTNNFIYGLSSYIGYKETSLYIKYDLNPLFKDNIVKQNNVSLGIRFDFN
ncbi:MAG: hypothetical protein PHC28_03850 [Flavobacterium sp.]|uniref:coiled-coil domain-containing protein n=1 Tax=Flavobacterium sp. TaxID=239 RepID=UPI00260EAAA7|nr:hypothetical protein [Flavobacterium sp.]MDD5149599.1 hypothetical protein [Flavobacterium sp.]